MSAMDDRIPTVRWGWLGWVLCAAALLGGCARPATLAQRIQDNDPKVRIASIQEAVELKDKQVVPLLVDRLLDQDRSVRFFASGALKEITGEDHGYDYRADQWSRRQAVARWRAAISADPEAGAQD